MLNRAYHKEIDKIHYELWKMRTPRLNHLRVCGSLAKERILEPKRKKTSLKILYAIFIHVLDSNANRFFIINSETVRFPKT